MRGGRFQDNKRAVIDEWGHAGGAATVAVPMGTKETNLVPGTVFDEAIQSIERSKQLYHRLVLVVGPMRSGKTRLLRDLRAACGWPLLNVGLDLSERLLDLTRRQRVLQAGSLLSEMVHEQGKEVVLLDNIELLFHPDLKHEPLRSLQGIARNRTVVASWRGSFAGRKLTYATPDHPEFRHFDDPEALIISRQRAA